MKKWNVTAKNIDAYLRGMAYSASKQLFYFCGSQIDQYDLEQEAQLKKIEAIKKYNPNVPNAIPLEHWIVFLVRRHFIKLARHLEVIARHQNLEASPESFSPVCNPEEEEYCEHLLSMVKIDKDRKVLEEYAAIQNDRIIANTLGVSKACVNFRRLRAIKNIHTQLEKTNV